MVRKQVLRARAHSKESLLKQVKSECDQSKLTLNINYYPDFQNVKNILEELHILLTKNITTFSEIFLLQGFVIVSKSLKDHLVRAKLSNVQIIGIRWEKELSDL